MTISKSFGSVRGRLAIGIAASCMLAGSAFAMEPTVVIAPAGQTHVIRHEEVRYADLDLGTQTGRATLDKRIRYAASDVCDRSDTADQARTFDYLNCYSGALHGARAQISDRLASVAAGAPVAAAP